MVKQPGKHDVRRSVRVPVLGTARVVWERGEVTRYTVDNLSLGGARILGHPVTRVGERIHTIVNLVGAPPMSMPAHVVREPKPRAPLPEFAIEFDKVTPEAEDLIHQLWLDSFEHPRQPTVLVVARSVPMRAALASLLSANGWRVVEAAAPLEAMNRLLLDQLDLRWIIVLDRLTQTTGIEFLAFVGDAYPGVRRLLISRPDGYRDALSAVDHGVADAAMLQPVRKSRLEQIIGHS